LPKLPTPAQQSCAALGNLGRTLKAISTSETNDVE
jgi:hypothetical protein